MITQRLPHRLNTPARLTCSEPMPTLVRFDERTFHPDEANVSAECPPQEEDPRIPQPDGHQGGSQGSQAAAGQGTQTADRLAGSFPRRERLTSGAEFQALFRSGKRIERPLMVVLWRPDAPGGTRRAGFTVSRQVRGAVGRNRVKRRLREAYRATRGEAPVAVALVIIGRPAVSNAPMTTLIGEMRRALSTIPGERATP
jgi:ribonuclease P protein component